LIEANSGRTVDIARAGETVPFDARPGTRYLATGA
jgi:hypothetical protein